MKMKLITKSIPGLPRGFAMFAVFFVSCILLIAGCKKNKDKPQTIPTVKTLKADASGTTSATLTGEITDDGNATITEAGFVYSSNVDMPTTADNKKTVTDYDTFTAELTSLNSGTIYNVRAYAINSKGTAYGEKKTFTTGNAAPIASNVQVTGVMEVGKTLTASYTYTDSENDAESGTIFQWHVADNSTGTGETQIEGATANTFEIGDEQNGKYIRVSVTPKASTGTTAGAEAKSAYGAAVGAETVTFTYNGEEVTYGTIISSTTQKKWLDRNLGASRMAESLTDYEAYGDFFQWGRAADGHQLITRTSGASENAVGVTGQTSSTVDETSPDPSPETNKFIVVAISFVRDWQDPQNANVWQGVNGVNNPCPAGWRLPTQDEWAAEFPDFSPTEAFDKLKLTYTGQRLPDGTFSNAGEFGYFWTSTAHKSGNSYYTAFYADGDASFYAPRATGYTCRCIKD